MKSNILIIIALSFSKMILAQDSIRVETVVDTAYKTPQYIAAYDDVFLSYKETKWLLKADIMGLLDKNINNGYDFSQPIGLLFEQKLGKSFSVNIGIASFLHKKFEYKFQEETFNKADFLFSYLVEPRWYFNMQKLMKKKIFASNLNGHYLSFRYQKTRGFSNSITTIEQPNSASFTLNYGIQKRVFNNMYFDYRFGFGALQNEIFGRTGGSDKPFWGWGFDNNFTVGLAFGGNKKENLNSCELFHCFETEKSLWKFDVRNILPIINNFYFSTALNTIYEFKFSKSGYWSLNSELDLKFTKYILRRHFSQRQSVSSGVYVSPRFYYNLKKQIAKGKSANNLSGTYVTTEIGFSNTTYTGDRSRQSLTISPKWGIQKRLFKNGF